ncbi:MAG: AzlC family ABC transporter permease [Treponema sp.]|jgi:4-azaleucine resistance transporter AzlC|nr:AzlC family ABC transporter permease [Treponema sp.]
MYGRLKIFSRALKYSFPVLLGYVAIGVAFGLLLAGAGYPWWLAPVMSVVMYAGAGQFIAVGLFTAGAGLWEALLVQLVVNARHMAYGITMFKRFNASGPFKGYLVFALTDETFALLSSLPEEDGGGDRPLFMFLTALLDQCYWIAGSLLGAAAGSLLPFGMEGIGFALTALFVVLMIEQFLQARKAAAQSGRAYLTPFLIPAPAAVLAVLVLPPRLTILAALAVSLILIQVLAVPGAREQPPLSPEGT